MRLLILCALIISLQVQAERQFFDESIPGLRYSDREEYHEEDYEEEETSYYEEEHADEEFDLQSCNPGLGVDTYMPLPNLSLGYE